VRGLKRVSRHSNIHSSLSSVKIQKMELNNFNESMALEGLGGANIEEINNFSALNNSSALIRESHEGRNEFTYSKRYFWPV